MNENMINIFLKYFYKFYHECSISNNDFLIYGDELINLKIKNNLNFRLLINPEDEDSKNKPINIPDNYSYSTIYYIIRYFVNILKIDNEREIENINSKYILLKITEENLNFVKTKLNSYACISSNYDNDKIT